MFNVGAQLRKTRKRSNLTLDQLAAASGVDRGTISRIELGHVSPRIDTIGFLCEAMNTSLSRFFRADEPPPESSPDSETERFGLAQPSAPGAPGAEDLPTRTVLPFTLEGLSRPGPDGYWPVPSSLWKGLLEVLERFEILAKNSHELILVKDRIGTILYSSPPCEDHLGYRPQELVGQRLQALIHPEDLDRYQEHLAALNGASAPLACRIRHKNQSWRRFSSRFSNQLHNPTIRAVVVNALPILEP